MTALARVRRSAAAYLGLVEEGDVTLNGLFEPGDAPDLEASVAFETAPQLLRQLSEFHVASAGNGKNITQPERRSARRTSRDAADAERTPLRALAACAREHQAGLPVEAASRRGCLTLPSDVLQRVPRAPPRQKMTDESKAEVVGQHVGPRQHRQRADRQNSTPSMTIHFK